MFSLAHWGAIAVLITFILLLFITRTRWTESEKNILSMERLFGLSLLVIDILYHVWLVQSDRWELSNSLPLELCSISLLLTIVLLWTGNRLVYQFVFYAGIGGALQAMLTPVLDMDFPHFRYFHFFYTHAGIILTALYFTWVKGYRPTFKGVLTTLLALNILLPFIFWINYLFEGNYMFLQRKPSGGSLLDFLGPYPWYILSLEIVAFLIFIFLWFLFKKK
ncbi:TIGR02206 family membrane protein [Psychrobacillus sp. AK 1817]|uniref:TIGR02206 family membrane protein n=2 Tax=Bacillaceae TaxID=186817 RepID=A0ABR8RDL6_9BACI|nr:TIGR02206 family membrane protein [Psychrobacillus faecigallinarum]QEY23046.1 TIGR02206 family membrane protein [Psychrobacillus sp. AK 1817]